jgi:hypothetical protein
MSDLQTPEYEDHDGSDVSGVREAQEGNVKLDERLSQNPKVEIFNWTVHLEAAGPIYDFAFWILR